MTAIDASTALEWSSVAAGWDAYRDHVERAKAELTERILGGLVLRPGEWVLEVGAGTGELARRLAAAVGERGQVLATDTAPGMVDLVRKTTADLPNVDIAQLDALDIHQPDASYDAVVFRMGLMLVPEPARALAEFHRVLKPGGRVATTTWAGLEHNPWLTCVGLSAMVNGLVSGGPPTRPGGVLSLGDAAELERLATDAGFRDVTVQSLHVSMQFTGVDDHLGHVTSLAPPLAAAFATASADQRAAVRSTLEQTTQQFRTDDGIVIPGRALLLIAAR